MTCPCPCAGKVAEEGCACRCHCIAPTSHARRCGAPVSEGRLCARHNREADEVSRGVHNLLVTIRTDRRLAR